MAYYQACLRSIAVCLAILPLSLSDFQTFVRVVNLTDMRLSEAGSGFNTPYNNRNDITEVMCVTKLLIHSQTSTAAPLKLGNGQAIAHHFKMDAITYPWCDVSKRSPWLAMPVLMSGMQNGCLASHISCHVVSIVLLKNMTIYETKVYHAMKIST